MKMRRIEFPAPSPGREGYCVTAAVTTGICTAAVITPRPYTPGPGGEMRIALTLAAALALVAAPAARAENIVAGPNSTYLTTSPAMDQGEALTFYSFDVPNHDVTARDKGPDGQPLFATPLIGFGDTAAVEGSQYLTTGQYEFFCSIHANMVGTLTVTGAGTPATRPGAGGTADTTRPSVKVKVRSGNLRRVRRSGRLPIEVSVDEAAAVALTAKARIGRRQVTIASGRITDLTGAGSRRETLRLSRAGKRRLAGRSRVPVSVTARAQDPAGNSASAKAGRTLR
jgi:plastocyanin